MKISQYITIALMMVAVELSLTKQRKRTRCFLVERVQKVPNKCGDRFIKLPICFGVCPTTDSLMIDGEDVIRSKSQSGRRKRRINPTCNCCRPVDFEEQEFAVECKMYGIIRLPLKVPTRCQCDSSCAIRESGYTKENLKIDRKDYMAGPEALPEAKRMLYKFLGKV
uniref:CTCK domain-containing protein n=1 Tax=Clytia hemisphaerica TaxID=252671 RepID=A0A7M5US26_9CNID